MVLINQWALLHDPEKYDQPEEFRPERFLDEQGTSLSLSLSLCFIKKIIIVADDSSFSRSHLKPSHKNELATGRAYGTH